MTAQVLRFPTPPRRLAQLADERLAEMDLQTFVTYFDEASDLPDNIPWEQILTNELTKRGWAP